MSQRHPSNRAQRQVLERRARRRQEIIAARRAAQRLVSWRPSK